MVYILVGNKNWKRGGTKTDEKRRFYKEDETVGGGCFRRKYKDLNRIGREIVIRSME
jgi:hypothetical protein